ncbi:MAG: DNA methyltransferase, partial [Chloroflexota bacterium]
MPDPSPWLNQVHLQDALKGMEIIPDKSIDLVIADPPYGLGKDYGNDSDRQEGAAFLQWTHRWIDLAQTKLKPNGSLYIFTT